MARGSAWKIKMIINSVKKKLLSVLMVLPAMILISFCIFGMIICISQVFANSLGQDKYFFSIILDKDFIHSFLYTFYIAFVQATISIILAILISYYETLNNQNSKILYIPISIPHIVVAMFTIYIFAKNGFVSHILHNIGIIKEVHNFPSLINDKFGIGIIISYVFKSTAYSLSIIYITMRKLHGEFFEVANVMGCDNKVYLSDILLPQLKRTICFCFLIIFVYAFGAYEIPFLLGSTQNRVLPILSYIEYTKPDINARLVSQSYNVIMFAVGILSLIIFAFYVGDGDAKKYN